MLASQRFVLGDEGRALEASVAQIAGAAHGVGCASGSDALTLALRGLDVDHTQAVVTTPHSFFATAGAARRLGTRVDFVDVDTAFAKFTELHFRRRKESVQMAPASSGGCSGSGASSSTR